MSELSVNGLLFGSGVDRDGELCVDFNNERTHLVKRHAIDIMVHLKEVFSINESELESISHTESDKS